MTRVLSEDRRARVSVTAIFALNGFLAAMWVAHIPVIADRTGVSHEQLGALLLLLGGSAFVAMQVCGPIIDRWGSAPTTLIGATVLGVAVLGPVAANDATTLALALAAFGFANGALDVSMNAQAVDVERGYARPIMSAFHGYFSIGSLVGSGIVAVTLWAGVAPMLTVLCAGGIGWLVVAVAGTGLSRRRQGVELVQVDTVADETVHVEQAGTAVGGERSGRSSRRWWHGVDLRVLTLMAMVAFSLMLAEGTAYDWSALHVVETFGTSEALGAVAFAVFSAAMTVVRFVVDPVSAAVGPVKVVRYGALLGALGMTAAVAAGSQWWAILGWAIFGAGLAGLIPQIFTAAGNLTRASSGRTISVVVGCGYLGMLAGPAVVGFLSGLTSLPIALTVAIAALLFAALTAGVVAPRATLEG